MTNMSLKYVCQLDNCIDPIVTREFILILLFRTIGGINNDWDIL